MERSENVTVVLNANAVGIHADETAGTVAYVLAKNLRGCLLRVRAGIFVLAASGLENARLRPNLRGRTGSRLGNRHGLIGRFYMEHPKAMWGKLVPVFNRRLQRALSVEHQQVTIQISLTLSERLRREHRLPIMLRIFIHSMGASLETTTRRIARLPRIVLNRVLR